MGNLVYEVDFMILCKDKNVFVLSSGILSWFFLGTNCSVFFSLAF